MEPPLGPPDEPDAPPLEPDCGEDWGCCGYSGVMGAQAHSRAKAAMSVSFSKVAKFPFLVRSPRTWAESSLDRMPQDS